MPYVSLYRKYRPQVFDDVIGQDHVVRTLQNALSAGKIANGYLFCGTRGVAKTTIARIFAKCLNCVGPDGDRTAPSPEPCNVCISCRTIAAGQSVDVIEMDAASNRSVSDMARLRENVQFGPMESRYKTYIVDEAHQLSTDAKDAFLKTLEEPPPAVVFILATTESHAIPMTIASRCQQFDFKRGTLSTITRQLSRVLEAEGVSMAPDAVSVVARAAEGSYRDALSLLEQVIGYKRVDVSAKDVNEVLGCVDSEMVDRAIVAIASQDSASAFGIASDVYTEGKDVRLFLRSLGARLRDLLYVTVGARTAPEEDEASHAEASRTAATIQPHVLIHALETLTDADRDMRFAISHRLLLEITLLRLTTNAGSVQEHPAAVSHAQPASPTPRPRISARTEPSSAAPATVVRQSPPAATPKPLQQAPSVTYTEADASVDPDRQLSGKATAEPNTTPGPLHEAPPTVAEPTPAAEATVDTVEYLIAHWQEAINHMQVRSPGGVRVMQDARPCGVHGHAITLEFASKVYFDMMESQKRRSAVEEVINKILRVAPSTYSVRPALKGQAAVASRGSRAGSPILAEPPQASQPVATPASAAPSSEPELIDEVISIFGGRRLD